MFRLRALRNYLFCVLMLFPLLSMGEVSVLDAKPPTANKPVETPLVETTSASVHTLPAVPVAPVPSTVQKHDPAAAVVQPTAAVKIEPTAAQQSSMWGLRPMNDSEFNSAMCVLGATLSMAATYAVGPNEVIMLVVGGVVVPSSPTVLFVTLFSTMAAAGCTIGESSTPALSWLYQN